MSSPSPGSSPAKSRWARMGGVVRRASSVLAPRTSTSSLRSDRDSDAVSVKDSIRSIPPTPPVLQPHKLAFSQPSPIPESPIQPNEASIPVSTEPTLAPVPEPEPIASPIQEYTPPPLIDSTAVGPGGFVDELDELPQPTVINDPAADQQESANGHAADPGEPISTPGLGMIDAPPIQSTKPPPTASIYSTDSYGDQVASPPAGAQANDAPSLKRTPSVDSHRPPIVDSATAGLGGFDDSFSKPSSLKVPSIHQEPDVADFPQETAPLVPTEPVTRASTPASILPPNQPPSYFDIPITSEPEDVDVPHEPAKDLQQTSDDVFSIQPIPREPTPAISPDAIILGAPLIIPELINQPAPAMPIPEPAAAAASSSFPVATFPQLESHTEVWGGIPTNSHGESTQRDVVGTTASVRSRASSIRSIPSADPFADPPVPATAPQILVSQHNTPPPMPQPQISDPNPPAPENRAVQPPVVVMPLPSVHDLIPSRPVYTQPEQTFSNGYLETNERLPLLGSTNSPGHTSYLQPSGASHNNIITISPQTSLPPASSTWPMPATHQGHVHAPPPLHEYGWIEYQLPDSTVYYVHPTRRVTADIDLRDERRLDALNAYFDRERDAPLGMELWLVEEGLDGGRKPSWRPPVRVLIDHRRRMAFLDHERVSGNGSGGNGVSGRRGRKGKGKAKAVEDDQLDMEYRYWTFMEGHPAHTSLPPNARAEAMDVLSWAWTDRLLPTQLSIPPPFKQEECTELMTLLRSFEQNEGGSQAVLHTRVVSRVLLRVAMWRQQYFRPDKPLPTDILWHHGTVPKPRRHFLRAVIDFFVLCLCFGIPYIFFERARRTRLDEESGIRTPALPMFIVGLCACLIAAVVLSTSVTFLCLPGLDNYSRIAGFVTILFATLAMASTLIALFKYKTEMDHPISHVAGEGLVMLTRRSVIMSFPVVFLVYAIIAFVTGIVLYSIHGSTDGTPFPQHPIDSYTKWTVIGALGGLGAMLFTSLLLLRR